MKTEFMKLIVKVWTVVNWPRLGSVGKILWWCWSYTYSITMQNVLEQLNTCVLLREYHIWAFGCFGFRFPGSCSINCTW